MPRPRAVRDFAPAALALMVLAAPPARAGDVVEDPHGVLNPQAFGMENVMRRVEEGIANNFDCIAGYEAAKAGLKHHARRIFEYCTDKGYGGAYPWMSWLEDTGATSICNSEMSAEWDRRAAATGDSLGQFNYGLALLRGYGVKQDEKAGRAMIDRAAKAGDRTARALIANGYDPRAVMPPEAQACREKLVN